MKWLKGVHPVAFAVVILTAAVALAGPLYSHLERGSARGYGTVVSTTTCAAARWTGWINTANVSDLVLDIAHTNDADGAISVVVSCESSDSQSTANDGGYEICDDEATPGTLVCPQTYTLGSVNAARNMHVVVKNVAAQWTNCKIDCGTDAGDGLTVVAYGKTP